MYGKSYEPEVYLCERSIFFVKEVYLAKTSFFLLYIFRKSYGLFFWCHELHRTYLVHTHRYVRLLYGCHAWKVYGRNTYEGRTAAVRSP